MSLLATRPFCSCSFRAAAFIARYCAGRYRSDAHSVRSWGKQRGRVERGFRSHGHQAQQRRGHLSNRSTFRGREEGRMRRAAARLAPAHPLAQRLDVRQGGDVQQHAALAAEGGREAAGSRSWQGELVRPGGKAQATACSLTSAGKEGARKGWFRARQRVASSLAPRGQPVAAPLRQRAVLLAQRRRCVRRAYGLHGDCRDDRQAVGGCWARAAVSVNMGY
jgi:hypothetical protein